MSEKSLKSSDNYQNLVRWNLEIISPPPSHGQAGLGSSVGCASNWRPGGRRFDPCRGQQHSFIWKFDHEIFSTVILSLPLIQEGQLSVSGKRMCTILVNRLED